MKPLNLVHYTGSDRLAEVNISTSINIIIITIIVIIIISTSIVVR